MTRPTSCCLLGLTPPRRSTSRPAAFSFTSPVEPVEHGDCLSALRAAANEIARLRLDVDAPLADLVLVMAYLAPALQHAQAVHDWLARDASLLDPELPDGPATS